MAEKIALRGSTEMSSLKKLECDHLTVVTALHL